MKSPLSGLMKQAQQVQDNMRKANEELEKLEVTGESGGGMVRATMTGKHLVRRIQIDDAVLSNDKDMLEDLIAAAVNDAVRRVDKMTQEKMSGLAGGLNLSGILPNL